MWICISFIQTNKHSSLYIRFVEYLTEVTYVQTSNLEVQMIMIKLCTGPPAHRPSRN